MKRIIASILILTSPPALAGEGEADAREQCRALVSGTYLGFMNDLDVLKTHLLASSESSFSLKARKASSIKELKALESKNEAQKVPEAELDEDMVGLRSKLEHTTEAIEESDVRIATIKDQIAAKEKAFAAFQADLKPVFAITNARIVSQGAYPIKLEYRHPCSPYNLLCPLPKEQATALQKLAKSLEDPTACERYAQIR